MDVSKPSAQIVKLRCVRCKQTNLLAKMFTERSLPEPYDTVQEGVVICPDCGFETHCYYVSDLLRLHRERMLKQMELLSKEKNVENLDKIVRLRNEYASLFDQEQSKYKEFMESVEDEPR
jgi:hypothetical protein